LRQLLLTSSDKVEQCAHLAISVGHA
jgi:hypothetical protein